jgi:hypothetical protein
MSFATNFDPAESLENPYESDLPPHHNLQEEGGEIFSDQFSTHHHHHLQTQEELTAFYDHRERLLRLQEALEEAYPAHYQRLSLPIEVR